MLGLGSSLEPATCSNLWRMSAADRERTIERLVSPTTGIGMNLMRICIGTPDFTGDPWYSYNDLPPGETDPELKRFSIEKDRAYILPVLKLARQKNPDLLFFASPWSPPGWMKSTGTMIGGELLPQWYPAYAEYFVKFIHAYEAEGIPIYAVTIQNEPGVDRAKEKRSEVVLSLLPLDRRAGARFHPRPSRAGLPPRTACQTQHLVLRPQLQRQAAWRRSGHRLSRARS